jgi:hypothetical protein
VAGRLTSEELGERVTSALAARTFGDLAGLLHDLPVEAPEPVRALDGQRAEEGQHHVPDEWSEYHAHPSPWEALPIGPMMLAIGLILMLVLFMAMGPWRAGPLPFLPMLFWGMFFFGGPRGGRRRRHF